MIADDDVIFVTSAEYQGGYKLKVKFNDDTAQVIDFGGFITQSPNPHISKYQDLDLFKGFEVSDGDLKWGDYDLCFPIEDLYENKNIERASGYDAA